jgi:uncharacterized Fe-S cluster-containing protein
MGTGKTKALCSYEIQEGSMTEHTLRKWIAVKDNPCASCESVCSGLDGHFDDSRVFQNVESKKYFIFVGDGYECYTTIEVKEVK